MIRHRWLEVSLFCWWTRDEKEATIFLIIYCFSHIEGGHSLFFVSNLPHTSTTQNAFSSFNNEQFHSVRITTLISILVQCTDRLRKRDSCDINLHCAEYGVISTSHQASNKGDPSVTRSHSDHADLQRRVTFAITRACLRNIFHISLHVGQQMK